MENSNNGIENHQSKIEIANQNIKAREVDIKTTDEELENKISEYVVHLTIAFYVDMERVEK